MAFSGLRSFTARISFYETGDRYSLRKAIRYIPKTLASIKKENMYLKFMTTIIM